MTGTLALVGGAEWTPGCEFDADLLARSGGDRVLIVPTALAYERPADAIERARSWFEALGAAVDVLEIYRRGDALTLAAAAPVESASFVYIAGGSPMHLRSVLKDTPVWDALVAVLARGGVLAGSGEGATVLSTHMVDSRGGAFTVGLDLLTSITVIPRYDSWSDDKWHRTVKLAPKGMTVLGIDERTAVVWDGASWTVSGSGTVTVHRDGHRVGIEEIPALG
jgi:cyanophycinase